MRNDHNVPLGQKLQPLDWQWLLEVTPLLGWAVTSDLRVHCGHFSSDSWQPMYCHSVHITSLWGFHVSFALILGLKVEPYDQGIIVHVFFRCRDGVVGRARWWAVLPCWEGVLPRSTPPRPLFFFLTFILVLCFFFSRSLFSNIMLWCNNIYNIYILLLFITIMYLFTIVDTWHPSKRSTWHHTMLPVMASLVCIPYNPSCHPSTAYRLPYL